MNIMMNMMGMMGSNSMTIDTEREIMMGDRVFARLVMGGRTIVEFMMNRIGSIDDLFVELRQMTRGLRGLAKLIIRNQSRGWGMERKLMLN